VILSLLPGVPAAGMLRRSAAIRGQARRPPQARVPARSRLVFRSGVFNRKTEEIELYRVRDSSLDEPLLLRLFGTGNIVLYATDSSAATFVLRAVKAAADVRQKLRAAVEAARDQKRVRSIEA